jgi:hypothetical protein
VPLASQRIDHRRAGAYRSKSSGIP